jgi:hypothetical protein
MSGNQQAWQQVWAPHHRSHRAVAVHWTLLVLLASFCVWTKTLVCKDAETGIPLIREFQKTLHREKV